MHGKAALSVGLPPWLPSGSLCGADRAGWRRHRSARGLLERDSGTWVTESGLCSMMRSARDGTAQLTCRRFMCVVAMVSRNPTCTARDSASAHRDVTLWVLVRTIERAWGFLMTRAGRGRRNRGAVGMYGQIGRNKGEADAQARTVAQLRERDGNGRDVWPSVAARSLRRQG